MPIPGIDWLIVELSSYQSISISVSNTIKIQNLTWPGVEKSNPGNVYLDVIDSARMKRLSFIYPSLLTAQPAPFEISASVVDKLQKSDIDVRYSFTFSTKFGALNGASFVLTFPSLYILTDTDPPIRVTYPEFTSATGSTGIYHYVTQGKVVIKNIGAVAPLVTFTVIINGLRNPDYNGIISAYNAEMDMSEFVFARTNNFMFLA
jgi:hypothetical protein